MLDGQYSVIEQWISVCIVRNGDGWLGTLGVSKNLSWLIEC